VSGALSTRGKESQHGAFEPGSFTNEALGGYMQMLRERVFETENAHQYFELLLEDIVEQSNILSEGAVVVALERTLLYGGYSLLGPLFHRQRFISVDCSPPSADERGAYNSHMFDDPRALHVKYDRRSPEHATGLSSGSADLVIVPNLVHHIRDQQALFKEMARILKTGGQAYVFEPLVRELHQAPDDYLRYTPFGLAEIFSQHGLREERTRTTGGPFSVIAYCWSQALQFFPDSERAKMQHWFETEELPRLTTWDRQHKANLVRGKTSFPMAFSVLAKKTT